MTHEINFHNIKQQGRKIIQFSFNKNLKILFRLNGNKSN